MEVTLKNIFDIFCESERVQNVKNEAFEQRMAQQNMEFERRNAEFERRNAAFERQNAEGKAAFERENAERKAETERENAERKAETERRNAETGRRNADFDKQHAAFQQEMKAISKNLSKKMAELGDSLGLYAEAQVQECIVGLFAERGIAVPDMSIHYKSKDVSGNLRYEVDILLYDTLYAIVIEVKHRLKKEDVDEHLERLQKCTEFPPRGTEGKILLGAVAGMIVGEDVETYAARQGFFVFKPSGDLVKMTNAVRFQPREWQTLR